MAKEVTITKLTKGYLLTYVRGFEFQREAELKQSDAIKRLRELFDEEDDG